MDKMYEKNIIKHRRQIHHNPEIGFTEVKTTEYIISCLEKYGIEYNRIDVDVTHLIAQPVKDFYATANIQLTTKVTTGVVGIIKGDNEGKTVALRADIDALMIQEKTGLEFSSKNKGIMHACGHDCHTAMLLGAAEMLSDNKDKINGTVKLVFQPAEEGPAPGGAKAVLESGLIDDVDAIFGIHVSPNIKTGSVEVPQSEAMASTDVFDIDIIGKGTHASSPHLGEDPIYMASLIINQFQGIISRDIDPVAKGLISVGKIQGGTAFNAIPTTVNLLGTVRALNEEVRDFIFKRMEKVVQGVTSMYNSTYEFTRIKGYSPTVNDKKMANLGAKACESLDEINEVTIVDVPNMGGEDFSFYLKKMPGAFIWLGCGGSNTDNNVSLHNSRMMLDENGLIIGAKAYTQIAIDFLK